MSARVEFEVRHISRRIDLSTGLSIPKTFGWVRKPLVKFSEALGVAKEAAPVDGVDIVSWMQESFATNAIIFATMEDYNRLGSELVGSSGDPYIPGVSLSNNYYWRSERNSEVKSRGTAYVVTPVGTYSVRANTPTTIAKRDFLGWAAWRPGRYALQWVGTLLWWKSLASRPIDQRVRFVEFHNMTAPQFFRCPPNLPLVNIVRVGLTSEASQTVTITGRSPTDYGNVMFSFKQDIPAGSSEIVYRVFGLRWWTDHVLEIQPQHGVGTVLDYIR